MPSDLDNTITEALQPSQIQRVENRIVTMNPKYEMLISRMKPRVPGGYVPAERFIPEYEGAVQYMGADTVGGGDGQAGGAVPTELSPRTGNVELKKYPYDFKELTNKIVSRHGRVHSWGSANQVSALHAAEWFQSKGHNVFVLWRPELWHINQSRRLRFGRGMDDEGFAYGFPPEPETDSWEVLSSMTTTENPKIRIYQPRGVDTEMLTFEAVYPQQALGGTMFGAPQRFVNAGARPRFAAPPVKQRRGFWNWLLGRKTRTFEADVGCPPGPNVGYVVSQASQPWFGPVTQAVRPKGMETKFATTQLATGHVIPAPRVMPPAQRFVRAPLKVPTNIYGPQGTLASMEAVFR